MKNRCGLSLVCVVITACSCLGQQHPTETPAANPIYASDGLFPTEKRQETVGAGLWRTDLIFGLPIALRAQRQIGTTNAWAEGGVALYGLLPSVFAGLRFDGRIYEGQRNAWLTRPGVDVYYSPVRGSGSFLNGPYNNIAALTLDNDLTWRHAWSDRVHGNLGLKAGFGVAFAGRNIWPVPILGLTCGLQY